MIWWVAACVLTLATVGLFELIHHRGCNPPVPHTLDEAALTVIRVVSQEDRTDLFDSERSGEDFATLLHHSLGYWIRDEWGLWAQKGALYEELSKRFGLEHADDLSSIILAAAYHRYHDTDPELELCRIARGAREYWREAGEL